MTGPPCLKTQAFDKTWVLFRMGLSLGEQEFTSPAFFMSMWISKIQYDFAGGTTKFKDVYLGLTEIPYLGKIRVGHMKEPFSLEEMTSSNNVTFMERALPNAFAPSRNTGLLISNHAKERVSWGVGVFRNTNDLGVSQGDGEFNFTGRLTGTPWHSEKGKKVVHVGSATAIGAPVNPVFAFVKGPRLTWRPGLWIPEL